jgi:hypothetical protein
MLDGLNTLACENFGFGAQPFVDIASRDSKSEPLLQLLDVALGALTAARNGTHIDGTLEQRKKELVALALHLGKIDNIERSHGIEKRPFNVWNVIPKWKKGAIPTR